MAGESALFAFGERAMRPVAAVALNNSSEGFAFTAQARAS